jgi:uncharacterized protein with von Willebrand factor type A (vWA) domain
MIEKFKEFEVLNVESIKEKLKEKIKEFERKKRRILKTENPYLENQKKLHLQKEKFQREEFYFEVFLEDIAAYKEIGIDDKNYWEKEIEKYEIKIKKFKNPTLNKKLKKQLKLSRQLILKKWEEKLNRLYNEWIKKREKELEEEFIKNTKEWLKKREIFFKAIKDLSFGNELFSLDEDELSEYDIKELKKWAEYIENSKELKKLADIIGRLKKAHKNYKEELVKVTKECINVKKRSEFKSEIEGVKLDNDLNLVLPHELAFLGEDAEMLFFKKYIEKSLICFESIAKKEVEEEFISKIEEEELRKVAQDEQKGPIILAIDTSGSMSGEPEAIAKAISLYIATKAKKENRDCFLINFSTSIETFEFTKKHGIKDLISFLKKSFHGGTDVTPAIKYAVNLMKNKYKNADLLVISDFIMGNFGKKIISSIYEAKKNKNRFYALIIGAYSKDLKVEYFDKTWIFNSLYGDIEILEEFENQF